MADADAAKADEAKADASDLARGTPKEAVDAGPLAGEEARAAEVKAEAARVKAKAEAAQKQTAERLAEEKAKKRETTVRREWLKVINLAEETIGKTHPSAEVSGQVLDCLVSLKGAPGDFDGLTGDQLQVNDQYPDQMLSVALLNRVLRTRALEYQAKVDEAIAENNRMLVRPPRDEASPVPSRQEHRTPEARDFARRGSGGGGTYGGGCGGIDLFGAGRTSPEVPRSQHLQQGAPVHRLQANPYVGNQLNPAAERLLEHMGHDSSALEVAALLSTSNTVDIQDRLKSVGLQSLPFSMIGDKQLFQALWADTCVAKSEYPTRVPFTYWDLTSNTVLPPWLPGESVGGKAALSPDETLGTDAARLAKTLAGAVSKASNHTRSFTKFSHWAASFWRWATAAVSCGQLTWVGLMAHFEVVCQIAHREQHTYKKASTFLAVLYDELARRALSQRTRARDPEISGCQTWKNVWRRSTSSCWKLRSHDW